jgi:hypothetical protein
VIYKVLVGTLCSFVLFACSARASDQKTTRPVGEDPVNDLYGDGKYVERWNWLVSVNAIDNITPFDVNEIDRLLYINAFTYAIRTKVEAMESGKDFWWSPLLTDNIPVQKGYYDGISSFELICRRTRALAE